MIRKRVHRLELSGQNPIGGMFRWVVWLKMSPGDLNFQKVFQHDAVWSYVRPNKLIHSNTMPNKCPALPMEKLHCCKTRSAYQSGWCRRASQANSNEGEQEEAKGRFENGLKNAAKSKPNILILNHCLIKSYGSINTSLNHAAKAKSIDFTTANSPGISQPVICNLFSFLRQF